MGHKEAIELTPLEKFYSSLRFLMRCIFIPMTQAENDRIIKLCEGAEEIAKEFAASQTEELIKENEGLNRVISKLFADKVEETRQLQSKIEELQKAFENNKEQLMELATHARDLESIIDEKNKEIERLGKLLDDIAKGEKMVVNRTGVGEYTVVFKGGDDVKKYYEDDFQNNL